MVPWSEIKTCDCVITQSRRKQFANIKDKIRFEAADKYFVPACRNDNVLLSFNKVRPVHFYSYRCSTEVSLNTVIWKSYALLCDSDGKSYMKTIGKQDINSRKMKSENCLNNDRIYYFSSHSLFLWILETKT